MPSPALRPILSTILYHYFFCCITLPTTLLTAPFTFLSWWHQSTPFPWLRRAVPLWIPIVAYRWNFLRELGALVVGVGAVGWIWGVRWRAEIHPFHPLPSILLTTLLAFSSLTSLSHEISRCYFLLHRPGPARDHYLQLFVWGVFDMFFAVSLAYYFWGGDWDRVVRGRGFGKVYQHGDGYSVGYGYSVGHVGTPGYGRAGNGPRWWIMFFMLGVMGVWTFVAWVDWRWAKVFLEMRERRVVEEMEDGRSDSVGTDWNVDVDGEVLWGG
ncbi:hypothetical protein P154DRAFT_581375 [Amniculicola lignicola CBS 123094]|uniref:Uncharacterized protein n=1 Tax=Amniculicola lignicola CBS 123094 TaxID=1392246 RepID=A0A6A5VZJ4_9PLEO|nr:hypothetical protein P154DRAFT_581375 [Amniculicola lignicola CBS 123094]